MPLYFLVRWILFPRIFHRYTVYLQYESLYYACLFPCSQYTVSPHISHVYGLSPVWVSLLCLFTSLFVGYSFPAYFTCIRLISSMSRSTMPLYFLFRRILFPRIFLKVYGLSLVWVSLICILTFLLVVYYFSAYFTCIQFISSISLSYMPLYFLARCIPFPAYFSLLYYIIGIKHDFLCINICWVRGRCWNPSLKVVGFNTS